LCFLATHCWGDLTEYRLYHRSLGVAGIAARPGWAVGLVCSNGRDTEQSSSGHALASWNAFLKPALVYFHGKTGAYDERFCWHLRPIALINEI